MNKKSNTISLRLSDEEYNIINTNCNNLNMNPSQYLRSLINEANPVSMDYRQVIAPTICEMYIRLQELGLEDDEITKKVHDLCQTLS